MPRLRVSCTNTRMYCAIPVCGCAGCREQRRAGALVRSGQGVRLRSQARAGGASNRCAISHRQTRLDVAAASAACFNLQPSAQSQYERRALLRSIPLSRRRGHLLTAVRGAQASPWRMRGSHSRRRRRTARLRYSRRRRCGTKHPAQNRSAVELALRDGMKHTNILGWTTPIIWPLVRWSQPRAAAPVLQARRLASTAR